MNDFWGDLSGISAKTATLFARPVPRWLWEVMREMIWRVTVVARFHWTLHHATRSRFHLTIASPKTKLRTLLFVDPRVSMLNNSSSQ